MKKTKKKKLPFKIYTDDLLNLAECNTELEFVQIVSSGWTESVRPVIGSVRNVPEVTHYAINYPFVKLSCRSIRGNQAPLEYERLS